MKAAMKMMMETDTTPEVVSQTKYQNPINQGLQEHKHGFSISTCTTPQPVTIDGKKGFLVVRNMRVLDAPRKGKVVTTTKPNGKPKTWNFSFVYVGTGRDVKAQAKSEDFTTSTEWMAEGWTQIDTRKTPVLLLEGGEITPYSNPNTIKTVLASTDEDPEFVGEYVVNL